MAVVIFCPGVVVPLNITVQPKQLADGNVQSTILNPAVDAAGNPAKLSFFGNAPIAQPIPAGNTHTVAAGSTTQVYADTTFDGGVGGTAYTFGDIVAALKELGLVQISPTTLSLRNLSLSQSIFRIGTASSGAIFGATAGSTITASGLPASITINGPGRSFAYDGTGSASSGSFTLTETLAAAVNSPNVSTINYTLSSGAINAPVYAIHTALGVTPASWDVTGDSTFSPGMYVHQQFAGDSGFTTNLKDYYTPVDASSWEANSESIGGSGSVGIAGATQSFVQPAGTYYTRCRFETVPGDTTNNTVSPWSNTVTDTISSSTAALSATDKSQYITTDSSYQAHVNANTNSQNLIRATIAQSIQKGHFETTLNNVDAYATPNGTLIVGIMDSSSVTAITSTFPQPGNGTVPGASLKVTRGSTATALAYNGANQAGPALSSAPASGDSIIVDHDYTAHTVHFRYRHANGTVDDLGTITMTSVIPASPYAFCGGYCFTSTSQTDQFTANFGASSWLVTPDTGFTYYG